MQRVGLTVGRVIAVSQDGQFDRLRRIGRSVVAFRLEENHWNGTIAPQLVVRRVFDANDRCEELYGWLRDQWAAARRDATAQQVFDEQEVEAGGARRHPLESPTFRSLLDEPEQLRVAA